MAKTTVQKTKSTIKSDDGDERTLVQYSTSIPKALAEFFELEQGDQLEWSNGSARNKMEVTIIEGDE
jgi:hypothetical protein